MRMMMPVIWLLMKLSALSLIIQGSAVEFLRAPSTFPAISPIEEGERGIVHHEKSFRSNVPSAASQPTESAPTPQKIKVSTTSPAYALAPPPKTIQAIVPSKPPTAPQRKANDYRAPVSRLIVSIPVASPSTSTKFTQNPPVIPPIMPETLPPSPHQRKVPENKAPVSKPIASAVPVALPPTKSQQDIHSIMPRPRVPPSILPVPVAPAPHKSQNSPAIHPIMPSEPSYFSPVPDASPSSTLSPTIHWKRDRIPVAAPPNEIMNRSSLVHPSPSRGGVVPTAPLHAPRLPSKSRRRHHAPSLLNPEADVSPTSTLSPSIHWKRNGVPVAAPPNEIMTRSSLSNHSPTKAPSRHKAMRHKAMRHSYPARAPFSSTVTPPNKESHPPLSSQPESFYWHHSRKNKIPSPAPASSYLGFKPGSTQKGPVIPPAPLHAPKLPSHSGRRHHAPSPVNPDYTVSPSPSISPPRVLPEPAHSPSSTASSGHTKFPFLSPRIAPSGSSLRNPKTSLMPPFQGFPPPPPNEDCTSIMCTEPLTNTPPGSPCGCVWPMQVALRLSVPLYTFFPLVSELAQEIAAGVFMKQSQVRIIGANAASQQAEKTIVLIDLVPLGEKFDNTTAFLTYQRFWHKQVAIKDSFFGNYEVLYVHYPGLPPSPPMVPSSLTMVDDGPYSGHDNNGRTIQPLGVDVQSRRHKDGLSGSIIAIIVLSAIIAAVLFSAAAWILLFRRRDCVSQSEQTPLAFLPSLSRPSGTAGSMVGSMASSASLSFASSIATYAGSAKTFSASEIERATDNFNASRILGEGGFGRVYSGSLEDGTKVAVKVLKRDDQQGGREFLAEVEMLSRLHHRNLVKLIGICTEERSRCLVYELIPNGSVESHLHGVDRETDPLDWSARIKIALGAARGLAYLHEDSSPRVIHRDFKSSNILLEHDFTPKVSDFGLARTAMDEENKHISTRVMGTFGYVAPEYAMTGHLLVKSDVYSYGVVLLELLTGRKPVDMSQPPGQENLVAWARPLLISKEGLEIIVDCSLGPNYPIDSVSKVAAIASMCVQPEVSHRPFMGEVVQALKLVCNECDETKETGSGSCSQEDLSIDLDTRVSTGSGRLLDPLQSQYSVPNYDSGADVEMGLSVSDIFSTSARIGRQASGSFRRHSSSGPLRTGRGRRFLQAMRRLSRGSLSEHAVMFRFQPGSH
ncbi:receptor-like serine/threonine-protein kinase ALE2 isoform X2 [Malania oleifera]|uniref:receptor-like serine/threonine-protein kinase ALE2 isoform X2 n=1 Tax=Malania oleifera TaxID=397392 RepID=UPI0025ADF3DD|nr:receptor-like serine/threonine-protein kinase ALE2 isoform X2 [Malania oleifera]